MTVARIAIILLTKNGAAYLEDTLDAIFAQESQYSFEVLAVDSGSTDATCRILESHTVPTVAIPPDGFQHGRTRNLAATLVSPDVEYLVYLSQDATPLPGWLDALVEAVAMDHDVAGAFSRHIPRPDCNPLLARRILEEWEQVGGHKRIVKHLDNSKDLSKHGHTLAHFSNTSSCLRREVWQAIPFPEVDFAEDLAWAVRVLESGYCLVYEPASAVLHSHSGSLSRLFRENIDHGRGARLALKEWATELMPPRHPTSVRIRRDLSHIWHLQVPILRRFGWALYAPLWYLAAAGGHWLGASAHLWPAWLSKRLSWQNAVQIGR